VAALVQLRRDGGDVSLDGFRPEEDAVMSLGEICCMAVLVVTVAYAAFETWMSQ
jgi:hypothetical protein